MKGIRRNLPLSLAFNMSACRSIITAIIEWNIQNIITNFRFCDAHLDKDKDHPDKRYSQSTFSATTALLTQARSARGTGHSMTTSISSAIKGPRLTPSNHRPAFIIRWEWSCPGGGVVLFIQSLWGVVEGCRSCPCSCSCECPNVITRPSYSPPPQFLYPLSCRWANNRNIPRTLMLRPSGRFSLSVDNNGTIWTQFAHYVR